MALIQLSVISDQLSDVSFQFTDYCLLVTENTPHLPLKKPTVIEILAEKSLQPGFSRNIRKGDCRDYR